MKYKIGDRVISKYVIGKKNAVVKHILNNNAYFIEYLDVLGKEYVALENEIDFDISYYREERLKLLGI